MPKEGEVPTYGIRRIDRDDESVLWLNQANQWTPDIRLARKWNTMGDLAQFIDEHLPDLARANAIAEEIPDWPPRDTTSGKEDKPSTDEEIMVFRSDFVKSRIDFKGGPVPCRDLQLYWALTAILGRETAAPPAVAFLPRSRVESDPAYLQPIPYIVPTDAGRVLWHRRTGGGEGRLEGKIGFFGGHVNRPDLFFAGRDDTDLRISAASRAASAEDAIRSCLRREWAEEIGPFYPALHPRFRGLIYSEESEVDRVHLGFLFTVEAVGLLLPEDDRMPTLSRSGLEFGWTYARELIARPGLETWARKALAILLVEGHDHGQDPGTSANGEDRREA